MGKHDEEADPQLLVSTQKWVFLFNRVGLPTFLLLGMFLIIIGKIDSPLVTMASTAIKTEKSLDELIKAVDDHENNQTSILNQLIRLSLTQCVEDTLSRNNSLGAKACTASLGPAQIHTDLINQALAAYNQQSIKVR